MDCGRWREQQQLSDRRGSRRRASTAELGGNLLRCGDGSSDAQNEVVSGTDEVYVLGLDEAIVAELEEALDDWLQALGPQFAMAHEASGPKLQPTRVVLHAKFGRGVLFAEEGSGDGRKMTIDFDDAGRKTLLARFVEVVDPTS